MNYHVFEEGGRPQLSFPFTYALQSPEQAVRRWVLDQRAEVWEDEDVWVTVVDEQGNESLWSVRTTFDFHIMERT